MANIIFITSKYLPSPDANGICVEHIIKQLQIEGHKIICICAQEGAQLKYEVCDGVEIYRVKRPFYAVQLEKSREGGKKKLFMLILTCIRRIRSLFLLPIFPNTEPCRTREIYRVVESIVKKNPIHCVIGVFRPFEGVAVAQKIKNKHPELICGAYYLDIMKGSAVSNLIPKKIYSKLCDKRELRIFNGLDFVLMAEAGKKIYKTSFYKNLEQKIRYINFPVFRNIRREVYQEIDYGKEFFNIVYAGYMDKDYRNPTFILSVIEFLCKKGQKIKMHLYGSSNCDNVINEFCRNNPNNFYYYGTVDNVKSKAAIVSADAVLNISNQTENIVPSKIFELFSSCKPIINVVTNPNDVSIQYFKYYPSVCFIEEYKANIEYEARKLMEFYTKNKDYHILYEQIEPIYYSNTPVATTNIINEYLNKKAILK